MTNRITDIKVSLNEAEEDQLRKEGFLQNPVNLNKRAGGDKIYLWYSTGSGSPITRIQISYSVDMSASLERAGYIKVDKDLNAGTGGDAIYLWYYKGSSEYDIPIVDLFVSSEPQEESQLFLFSWERLACNLNRRSSGLRIYLWVRKEKTAYISDITATADFQGDDELIKSGYVRLDENTNRGAGGKRVFIWYRQTTDSNRALTDLQISTSRHESEELARKHYKQVDQDLNEGAGGVKVFLWFKKQAGSDPIKTATLVIGRIYVLPYERAGVQAIEKSLNSGNDGAQVYLCFYQ
ncbi:uncharacterized protein ACNS7B_013607 [Menidia menidia]